MRGDCRPAPVQTAPRRRRRRPTPWRRRRDPQRCELDRVRSGRMLGGAWPCARPARIQNCEHLYSFLESVKIINKLLLAVTCARPKSRGRLGPGSAEWNAGGGVVPWRPPAGLADRSMEGCHAGGLVQSTSSRTYLAKDMELDAVGRQLEALLPAVFCMAAPV